MRNRLLFQIVLVLGCVNLGFGLMDRHLERSGWFNISVGLALLAMAYYQYRRRGQ